MCAVSFQPRAPVIIKELRWIQVHRDGRERPRPRAARRQFFRQSVVDAGVEGHVPDAIVESKRLATGDAVVSCRAVGCVVPYRNLAVLTDASSRKP
jgi:hypothetical protein